MWLTMAAPRLASAVMNLQLNEQDEEMLLMLIMVISKAALRLQVVDWVVLIRDAIRWNYD